MGVRAEWVKGKEMESTVTVGSCSKRVLLKIEELLDEPLCSFSVFSPSSSALSSSSSIMHSFYQPVATGFCLFSFDRKVDVHNCVCASARARLESK